MALTEAEELELLELEEEEYQASQASQPFAQEGTKKQDLLSSIYTGAITGGAMTLGGAAAGIAAAPAGPVASGVAGIAGATAMYPMAKRAAEGIDRWRGITPPQQESLPTELTEGLAIEATGAALRPVMKVGGKVLGKVLPGAKTGEMLSGTPASNLKRAYKQGFVETYLKPKTKAAAGEAFGSAKSKLMQDFLTPDEQAAMLVNPRGEANAKIADTFSKFIKGETVSAQEAVAVRQAIDTAFPPETARNLSRISKFSEFRGALNDIINREAPEFAKASKDYASSALRSQLLKPFRVNKSNPEQYSKLSGMLAALLGAGGAASGAAAPAVAYAVGTSPLAMGVTSSLAGSASGIASKATGLTSRAVMSEYIDRLIENRRN